MTSYAEIVGIAEDNARKRIALNLIKRANYLLKNCKEPDSPMILVATELKIQADEIFENCTKDEVKK